MDQFLDLLTLPAVQRSAIGLAIAAIGLPIVGVFIIGLDIIAVRFAIMHVALLGIAVGLLTGLDPTVCGLIACALAGAGVAPLSRRPAGLSGAMGLLMTFAIAGALLVLSASGVNATGAFELLWGSILATRVIDLAVIAALTVAVHLLFWRYRRQLTLLLFDRELALCSGVPAGSLMLALLVVVAVAIGASISLTGALLVDALTILPALAARNLGRSLTSMVGWAVGFGVVGNTAGFTVALVFDQPPGPVLVLVAGSLTLLTYLIPEGVRDAIVPSRRSGHRTGRDAGALTACGSTDDKTPAATGSSAAAGGPKVVASTSWVGALAKAAGVADVTVIAPASVQHPPDYDPKPSDLASVAGADYVLFAEFDGFAAKIKEAAGGKGELVPVELENTPEKIKSEVTRLGTLFGTQDKATTWLATFDAEYAKLSGEVKAKLPSPAPTAVSHLFMAYWAEFAGLQVTGTYGPQPVTPSQLQELTGKKPGLVLANAHVPGANPDIEGAKRVDIVNYPKDDLDLLGVFRTNAASLTAAFGA